MMKILEASGFAAVLTVLCPIRPWANQSSSLQLVTLFTQAKMFCKSLNYLELQVLFAAANITSVGSSICTTLQTCNSPSIRKIEGAIPSVTQGRRTSSCPTRAIGTFQIYFVEQTSWYALGVCRATGHLVRTPKDVNLFTNLRVLQLAQQQGLA